MRDADWLEPIEDDAQDGPPRARPLLLALASVPWLVVIALLVLPGRWDADGDADPGADAEDATDGDHTEDGVDHGDPDTPAPGNPAPNTLAPDTLAPDTLAPAGDGAGDAVDPTARGPEHRGEVVALEGFELRGRWRVEAGTEEAIALAVVAGRAWLTGVAPVLDLGFDAGTARSDRHGGYAEHLVVEAVEQPAADAAVVTLVAVVLDATENSTPAVRRLAVPVALTRDGPRLAGAPWELPPPVLDLVTLPREANTDAADLDAARRALVAAGLTQLDLVGLHRTRGWPVVAEVVIPGTDVVREVWLRRHLDGYVVAGTTLAGASRDMDATPSDPAPETTPDTMSGPEEARS